MKTDILELVKVLLLPKRLNKSMHTETDFDIIGM